MKNIIITLCTAVCCLLANLTLAQDSDTSRLRISGYVDAYYSYFTDSLGPNELQQYTTVSARSQRFGLNVAQLGAHYQDGVLRGNVVLHYGDIAQATWSGTFNPVQEANLGVHLGRAWWLDGGFFTTHIGTESFLPKNNYLSFTAVATYNEPFYQAGARLSYEGSDKFRLQLWAANGYNFFLDANDAKSVDLLLGYQLSDRTSITYTNLFGVESTDEIRPRQLRTYQNLYLNTSVGERLLLTLGGDLGTQNRAKLDNGDETAVMYNALLTARYRFDDRFSLTTRAEVFQDPEGFISGTLENDEGQAQGLQLWGVTFGAEYRPTAQSYLLAERRYLQADDQLRIFNSDDPTARWEAMVTMGFYFDKEL